MAAKKPTKSAKSKPAKPSASSTAKTAKPTKTAKPSTAATKTTKAAKPAVASKSTSKAVKPTSKDVPAKKVPVAAPSAKKAIPKAPESSFDIPMRPAQKLPPLPSRPLTPTLASVPPPPPVIPMPPRPPGPPLLRKIQPLKEKPPEKLSLKVGDKAVHPRHGVGEVMAVQILDINNTKVEVYVLQILTTGQTSGSPPPVVKVPVGATSSVGLRPIMSVREADSVLDTMRAKEVAVNEHPWSRRFRAYTEMINSGSPYEVAKVMRDMYRLKFDKDLSFGERRLLDQAKSLLMKELALAKGMSEDELQAEVSKMFENDGQGNHVN